jgi:trimeric autotransporter adhesin
MGASTSLSASTGTSVTATPTTTTTYTVTGTNAAGCVNTSTVTVTISTRPTITSVTPLLGYPASSVSIVGTNFNATTTNNIVYFGATQATVTSATTTTLNVTVPTGATFAPLTVLNTGCGLNVSSPRPYLPYYNNAAYVTATTNFKPNFTKSAGSTPMYLAIGDMDGDGKTDIVTTDASANTVYVLRNVSSGGTMTSSSLSTAVGFTTGSSPGFVRLGDIDGDGKLDIVVSNGGASTISVFRNTSSSGSITSGSFAAKVDFTMAGTPANMAIADLDGDGKQDISVCNNGTTISVLRNTSSSGSITMATRADFTAGNSNIGLTAADLDGDGKIDLACANNFASGSSGITVLRNTTSGTISFASGVTFSGPWSQTDVITLDIDGDGKLDLAAVGHLGLSVWQNTATSGVINSGSFGTRVDYTSFGNARTIASGDFDGDGRPDLVGTYYLAEDTRVFRNLTTGSGSTITTSSFAPYIAFPNVNQTGLAVGDLDGDGKADIITGHNVISVLQNDPLQPITGTAVVCAGSTTTLANAATGGRWSSSNPAIAAVGSTTGVVTGVTGGTVSITYAGTAGATFSGNIVITTVTVNANPSSTGATNSGPICVGGTATLSANSTNANSWSWTGPGGFVSTLQNPTATPTATGTYSLTLSNTTTGCSPATVYTTTITVNPVPSSTGATNSGSICVGGTATLSANSSNATAWSWTGPGGFTSALQNPTATPTATGTYSLTVSSTGSGCTPATVYTTAVTVNPVPSSTGATNSGNICVGGTVTLSANSSNATAWSWSGPSGFSSSLQNPTATPTATGTYSLTVSSTGSGCTPSTVYTTAVTVNPVPSSTGATNSGNICVGGTVTLSANSSNATAWSWSGPSGFSSSLQNPTATPTATGTYSLTVSSTGSGCNPSTVYTTTFTVSPVPSSTGATNSGPICVGGTVTLTANSSDATAWSWNGPGGFTSALQNPTATPTATGTYSLTVSSTGSGCNPSTVYTTTVTVNPVPSSTGATNSGSICVGGTVTLSANSSNATSWSWTGPGGFTSALQTPTATPTATGTYSLTVSSTGSGCTPSTVYTTAVTVSPVPSSTGATNSGPICVGGTVTLSANSSNATAWSWSGPSGFSSSLQNPTATTTATGTYSLTVSSAGSGCTPSTVYTTTVTAIPIPDTGTISGANNVNRGATTLLTEDVPGGVWSVSNSNASISVGGLVTGVSGGSLVISYGVTNICGTFYATKTFRVNAISDAIYGPAVMCVGLESTFTHPFTGGTWSSSDTAILTVDETTGEATAVTSGAATISYFADMSYQTKSITVNTPLPAITGSASVCLGSTLALSHASEGGIWSTTMGHVATVNSSTGVVTPVTSGVVFITYTLGTGCHTVRLFTINPLPGVISGSMIVCQGNTTTLSSSTFSGAWTSGTPAVATINVSSGLVTGVSPGTTAITYTALTGCVRNAIVTVNAPLGSITGDPQVCVGNTNATLVAPAPGGTWSSSNTSVVTAHATTGLLTGIGAGTATISYIAGPGCVTSIVATVSSVAVITGSDNMCAGSGFTLSNATPGGVWSSSNTTVATVVAGTGVVTGVAGGTAHISYALTTGCYKTKLVTVNSLPNNINGTAILCSGNTTALTNATSGGTWSSSTPAIATIGTSGIVSGVSAGTSTISYTLSTGCRATRIVTVNTTPAVITGTGILCAGNTTSLSSATPGGVWSSANTSIATINSGTGLVTGVSGGTSTISYTIGACFRISVVTVTPLPATITGLLALCVGNTSTLLSATTGGTWVSSDVSKATIHSTTGVATGIGAGTSNITYTKTGCITTAVVTVSTVAAITGTAVLCPGNTTTLAHVTPGGTWSSANTARATVGSASGIVTGLSSGTVRISYILTGACAQSIVVTVNPLPNSISGTSIICVGSTTTFSSTTGGGVWSSSTPATATVSVAGLVTGVGAGTSTITYQLATGCFATRVVTVSVAPGAITGTASVCIGSTTALGATPGGGVWSSSNITKATIDAGTGIATGVAAGTTFITYALGSCRSTRVLTVLATPGAISGALLTCAGSTTQLASPTFAGAWSSTDVTKATIHPTTGMVSGVAIGTSTISYVVSGCARTAVVTVNAAVGAITGTPLVCVGQTIATLVGPGGGTWSSSNASIANVHSITAILTGVGAGNATITYRVSAGCYSTIVSTVNAAIPSITGTLSVCEGGVGSTTTLANATLGGTWASSNTLKATVNSGTGEVTGVGGGSTTISYILSTGCYKTTTFTVNFVPTPFDATGFIIEDAPPLDTVMISSIAGGIWESGHPLIATIVPDVPGKAIVTGVSPGFATISYTFPTGCMRTGVIEVVAARPGNPGPGKGQTGVNSIYSLYPNPTSGIININSPVRGMLVVYTIDGKQVAQYALTASANMVSLPSNLSTGIYMCRFSGADGTSAIVRLVYEQ